MFPLRFLAALAFLGLALSVTATEPVDKQRLQRGKAVADKFYQTNPVPDNDFRINLTQQHHQDFIDFDYYVRNTFNYGDMMDSGYAPVRWYKNGVPQPFEKREATFVSDRIGLGILGDRTWYKTYREWFVEQVEHSGRRGDENAKKRLIAESQDRIKKADAESQAGFEKWKNDERSRGSDNVTKIAVLLFFVAVPVLGVLLLIWIARDAKNRGMDNAVVWTLFVLFLWPIALPIYLASRPKGSLIRCGHCENKRLKVSAQCPHCGNP